MPRKFAALGVGILGAVLIGACGDDGGGSSGATAELVAKDISFDPTTLEFPAGEEVTVTLTNEDETEHSFTIDDLEVETEAEGGESSDATFTAADEGTVEFYCKYHPEQMTGEITVN